MHITLNASARSHVGRRTNNEDAFLVDLRHRLFVVADGMGGYEGGEVASRLTVDTIGSFFARNEDDADLTWPWGIDPAVGFVENLVSVAVRLANLEVMRKRQGHLAAMGSTVVVAATDGKRLVVAHVGDSRVYRLRDGHLEQLTDDHSLARELTARGFVEHPTGMSHIITRAIGQADTVQPDVCAEAMQPGDTILLCSDGLTDPLEDAALLDWMAHEDLDAACAGLVQAAYDAGGSDNITALLVRAEPENGVRTP